MATKSPRPSGKDLDSESDVFHRLLNIGRQTEWDRRSSHRRRPSLQWSTPKLPVHIKVITDNASRNTTTPSETDGLAPVSSPRTSDEGDRMGGSTDDKNDRSGVDGDHDHDKDDHDDDKDHDHDKDHEDFSCQPTTSQHSAYIRENLELLQKKCNEFHECTKEVYSAENFHNILSGGNIQLSNMCGLMYANGGGKYTTLNDKCSRVEREAIRQGIGTRLVTTLADPPRDSRKRWWKRLDDCLKTEAKPNEENIDTVCRLKKNSTFLCGQHDVDHTTEEFFNHEMEHLHCSCKAISAEAAKANTASSGLPLPVRIGISGGVVGLLVILIIVIIILCLRHRKIKRKLSKHRMQYLPSPHCGEPSAVYQEIGDPAMDALRRARDQGKLPTHYNYMGQAPALPDRYVKDISRSRNNLAAPSENDPEYLEPIADPHMGHKSEAHYNDAYNASQTSQRSGQNDYDIAKHPANTPPASRANQPGNGTYFDRIDLSRRGNGSEDDGGYSSLSRKHAAKLDKERAGDISAEETEPLNKISENDDADSTSPEEPSYFVLEKEPSERDALTTASTTIPV